MANVAQEKTTALEKKAEATDGVNVKEAGDRAAYVNKLYDQSLTLELLTWLGTLTDLVSMFSTQVAALQLTGTSVERSLARPGREGGARRRLGRAHAGPPPRALQLEPSSLLRRALSRQLQRGAELCALLRF